MNLKAAYHFTLNRLIVGDMRLSWLLEIALAFRPAARICCG
jgi:hypothetical protein